MLVVSGRQVSVRIDGVKTVPQLRRGTVTALVLAQRTGEQQAAIRYSAGEPFGQVGIVADVIGHGRLGPNNMAGTVWQGGQRHAHVFFERRLPRFGTPF